MSFGAVVGGGTDSTFALRIGLTGLKPIRVREIIKKYGIKFTTEYTSYKLDSEITSFEEFTKLRYNQVFSNISVPDYFDPEKLADYYAKKSIDSYNKDTAYKEKIEEAKKSRGSLGPLKNFVIYVKERYQDDINKMYYNNASNFYASDLPFSVFNDFSRTDHLYANFLNLIHHTLNYYDRRILSSGRDNQIKFNKIFSEMKKELDVNFDLIDEMVFTEKCLQRLIIVWNAKNYNELHKLEKTYYKNIPNDEFNKLYFNLKKIIRVTRMNILTNRHYREDEQLDVKAPEIQYNSDELLKNIFYQDNLKVPVWATQ